MSLETASFVALPRNNVDNLVWRADRQWHRWFPE
jgi:hypothetical protein